jgi:hypothetical protein
MRRSLWVCWGELNPLFVSVGVVYKGHVGMYHVDI